MAVLGTVQICYHPEYISEWSNMIESDGKELLGLQENIMARQDIPCCRLAKSRHQGARQE